MTLIDFMILPIDKKFLSSPQVDMTFRIDGKRITMTIYDGSIQSLLRLNKNFKVTVIGSMSDIRTGTIIDHDVGYFTINNTACKGVFAVRLDKEFVSQGNYLPRIAQEGDSGALVYGNDPRTGQYIAIGLVWAGNRVQRETDEAAFLTYCTPLSSAVAFAMKEYGKDLKFYNPPAKDRGTLTKLCSCIKTISVTDAGTQTDGKFDESQENQNDQSTDTMERGRTTHTLPQL